jgi:hypothetical protein
VLKVKTELVMEQDSVSHMQISRTVSHEGCRIHHFRPKEIKSKLQIPQIHLIQYGKLQHSRKIFKLTRRGKRYWMDL